MKIDTFFKSAALMLVLFLTIFTLEIAFRFSVLRIGLGFDILRIALFSFAYAAFITFFLRFFSQKIMRRLTVVFVVALTILYFSQHVFYLTVNGFYSFSMTGDVTKGLTFISRIISNLRFSQLLYLLPIAVLGVTLKINQEFSTKLFTIRYDKLVRPFYSLLFAVLVLFISIQTISTDPLVESGEEEFNFSDVDLYHNVYSPHLAIDRFGLLTYARLDLETIMFGSNDSRDTETMRKETDDFFSDYSPPNDNDYTGYFEDKNLIMILAESLEPYAINSLFMPNLNDMKSNSLIFDNYYAPLYYRNTADSEFMMHTSFYPDREIQLSMDAYGENVYPNTLPRHFSSEGYESFAFHNYTDYYYPRGEFHPNTLGFDTYKGGIDMGLLTEEEGKNKQWTSDLKMMRSTLDDVLQQDKFFSYFLTVSGHLDYDEDHPIASKNIDTIENILVNNNETIENEEFKYYLAAQYEFDLALGYLIDELEASNKLDDTVIMISADHYAYGLDNDTHEEFNTTKDLESTNLNMHNLPLMLYNPSVEETHIDSIMSNIDIMPTIANLFSLNDMNYNKAMGNDVFDESTQNTVWFQDSSFMTDDYFMDIANGQTFGYYTQQYDPQDVLLHYNRLIHRSIINRFILQNDYFGENISLDVPDSN